MSNHIKKPYKFIASTASIALAITTLAPLSANAKFNDVPKQYKEAVTFLQSKGIKGISNNTFGTNRDIKRVDAAVMLAKAMGLSVKSAPASGFKDVPDRAVPYVNALKYHEIVKGVSKTQFNSNSPITRGEMAIMLQRAYNLVGSSSVPFKDATGAFKNPISALYENGVTYGISKNMFGTALPVKRGDFANFLLRASKVNPDYDPNNPNSSAGFKISQAKYLSSTQIELTFSKAVDSVKVPQFAIEGVRVTAAKLATDKRTVTLTVTEMNYDKTYTVRAEGIMVNKVQQGTVSASFKSEPKPPNLGIASVNFMKLSEIEVYLNKAVDSVKTSNFAIDGVAVKSAKLSNDKRKVTLTVDILQYAKTYTVKASGIMVNKKEEAPFSKTFTTPPTSTGPTISAVKFNHPEELEVTLSKPIDSVKANSFIIDGVKAKSAVLNGDRNKVTLTVEALRYSSTYKLTAEGLIMNKDRQPSSSFTFMTPGAPAGAVITGVKYIDMNEIDVTFSQEIDPVKASNFSIPDMKITGAKLQNNKRTVTVNVEGLQYDTTYPVKASGITVHKYKQPVSVGSFKTAEAAPENRIMFDGLPKFIKTTEMIVKFSKEIDSIKPTNFNIPGVTVKSTKLGSDKRTVTLTVDILHYKSWYSVEASGITVKKELQSKAYGSFITPDSPVGGFLEMKKVQFVSPTTVQVLFNREVDSLKPSNFTLDKGKKVTAVKLESDKRTATLTVTNLDYETEYKLTTDGIMVNKEVHPQDEYTFTTLSIAQTWGINIRQNEVKVLPNNTTETVVNFELINRITHLVDTKAESIVLELSNDEEEGRFDKKQITLKKGVGSAVFRAPARSDNTPVKVTAKIVGTPIAYEGLKDIQDSQDIWLTTSTDASPFVISSVVGQIKDPANADDLDKVIITFSESFNENVADLKNFSINNKLLTDRVDPPEPVVPPAPITNGAAGSTRADEPTDDKIPSNYIQGVKLNIKDSDNNPLNGSDTIEIVLPKNASLDTNADNSLKILNTNLVSFDGTYYTGPTLYTINLRDASDDNILNHPEDGPYTINGTKNIQVMKQNQIFGPSTSKNITRVYQGNIDITDNSALTINSLIFRNIDINDSLILSAKTKLVTMGEYVKLGTLSIGKVGMISPIYSVHNDGAIGKVIIEQTEGGITFSNNDKGRVGTVEINTTEPVTLVGNYDSVVINNDNPNVKIMGKVGTVISKSANPVVELSGEVDRLEGSFKHVVIKKEQPNIKIMNNVENITVDAKSKIEIVGRVANLFAKKETTIAGSGSAMAVEANNNVIVQGKAGVITTNTVLTVDVTGEVDSIIANKETTITGTGTVKEVTANEKVIIKGKVETINSEASITVEVIGQVDKLIANEETIIAGTGTVKEVTARDKVIVQGKVELVSTESNASGANLIVEIANLGQVDRLNANTDSAVLVNGTLKELYSYNAKVVAGGSGTVLALYEKNSNDITVTNPAWQTPKPF